MEAINEINSNMKTKRIKTKDKIQNVKYIFYKHKGPITKYFNRFNNVTLLRKLNFIKKNA